MAAVVRRHIQTGPTLGDLQTMVQPSAVILKVGTSYIDIQVDDSLGDVNATLDDFMATQGYSFDTAAPPPQTELRVYSPDGTEWAIRVANDGTISTVAI